MFDSFISLGCNCLIASALSKYGLRSFSGPFDWCVSDMAEGVLPLLENDFSDFLQYENLRVMEDNKKVFRDVFYKITYPHDVERSLEAEYDAIRLKYERRIRKFLEAIQKPTCFVRGIWSAEELSADFANQDRIYSVVKKFESNEIIYVIPRIIYERNPVKLKGKIFLVEVKNLSIMPDYEGMKETFDSNDELVEYCICHYRKEKRKDNQIFDLKKELETAKREKTENSCYKEIENLKAKLKDLDALYVQSENRNSRWMRLLNTDFRSIEWPGHVCIYGCGAVGRIFYQKVKNYCKVECFIDRTPRQLYYEEIPVVTVEQARMNKDMTVIIVPSYDYEKIVDRLTKQYGFRPVCYRLEEMLAQGNILDPYF